MAFFPSNISFSKSLSIFLILASAIATCLGSSNQDLSSIQRQECIHQHFSALLRLRRSFQFVSSYTSLSSWNPENNDCCTWEGITCDTSTGYVISLDLGELHISGQIHFQSLSHLRSLHILNLGYNWFDPSPIPSAIGQLDKLTHLNLSWGNFYGQIPMEMSSFTRLVSLDLSSNPLKLEKPSIGALIQNMSSLRELFIDGVDMSTGESEWSQAISSSLPRLRKLSMYRCGISGPIHPSFYHLAFLSHLDLSCNNLSFVEFDFIRNLSSLTSLSLGKLHGKVSDKILRLPHLSELDLSYNNVSSAVLDFIIGNLSSLTSLRLADCGLHGRFSDKIWRLPRLSVLDLSNNDISSAVLDFIGNLSSLTSLFLGNCGLRGKFYGKIWRLPRLSELDLSSSDISSTGLYFIGNLSSLTSLSLSDCGFDGRYLDKIWMLPCLAELHLSSTNFSSVKPRFFGNFSSFKSLTQLSLRECSMSGPLPTQLGNFTRLELLDLSYNSFSGSIPSSYGNDLLNLKRISLGGNLLNGTIPSSLLSLPSLLSLSLPYNQLGGQPGEFHNASSSPMESIDLSNNKLQGMIPRSIFKLRNLKYIYLYSNNFSDALDVGLFLCLTELAELALSNIDLSVIDIKSNSTSTSFPQLSILYLRSCNMRRFPDFLRNQGRLQSLDLSGNQMDGEIPTWIWNVGNGSLYHLNLSHNAWQTIQTPTPNLSMRSLDVLDLSFNVLKGLLPVPSSLLRFFSVSNNSLSGEIPMSICNLTSLRVLHVSDNNFTGRVPQCVGEMSNVLAMLHLQGNAFNGSLPQTFKQDCSLRALDFSRNQFEGQLPISISNCKGLTALNLRSNQMYGSFPSWIQGLAELRILDLGSNHFYGPIELPPRGQNFSSKLQIVDLSFNNFNGSLPSTMFRGWMEMTGEDKSQPKFLDNSFDSMARMYCGLFCETVVITSKSLEMAISKIRTDHTVLDLSNNHFQGQIPESIGMLKSLRVLNMSHNQFTGGIPVSMKNLTMLESLDLSQNNISGRIPQELLELIFLEVLNLSGNQLTGAIPYGKQFSTFTDKSFEGNPELCGPPLPKQCGDANDAPPPISTDEELLLESEYNWKMVVIGFGIGYGVGLGVFCWTLVLWTKGRKEGI